jgi:hypothetical protein
MMSEGWCGRDDTHIPQRHEDGGPTIQLPAADPELSLTLKALDN